MWFVGSDMFETWCKLSARIQPLHLPFEVAAFCEINCSEIATKVTSKLAPAYGLHFGKHCVWYEQHITHDWDPLMKGQRSRNVWFFWWRYQRLNSLNSFNSSFVFRKACSSPGPRVPGAITSSCISTNRITPRSWERLLSVDSVPRQPC